MVASAAAAEPVVAIGKSGPAEGQARTAAEESESDTEQEAPETKRTDKTEEPKAKKRRTTNTKKAEGTTDDNTQNTEQTNKRQSPKKKNELTDDCCTWLKIRNRVMTANSTSDMIEKDVTELPQLGMFRENPTLMIPMRTEKERCANIISSSAFRRALMQADSVAAVKKLGGKVGSNEYQGLKKSLRSLLETIAKPLADFEAQVDTAVKRAGLEKEQAAKVS